MFVLVKWELILSRRYCIDSHRRCYTQRFAPAGVDSPLNSVPKSSATRTLGRWGRVPAEPFGTRDQRVQYILDKMGIR